RIASNAPAEFVSVDSSDAILLYHDEPLSIVEAAQDLATDFEKVLGKKPKIVSRVEDSGPVTIWIGEKSRLPEGMRPEGLTEPESFSISVIHSAGKSQPSEIVLLTGADIRGTLYAIYEFSERY